MRKLLRPALLALLVATLGLGDPGAAFAQGGAIRSQTNRITGAISNQARQAVKPRLTIRNSAGEVVALAMSADGKYLAIALRDNSVRVWDLQNGLEQARIGIGERLRTARLSGDNRRAVAGTETGALVIADAGTGAVLQRRAAAHQGAVLAIDVSRDGALVVSGGADRTVRLWDAASGREVAAFRGHGAEIASVALSPDGNRVVAGAVDGRVLAWNRAAPAQETVLAPAGSPVVTVGFDPGGRVIATAADGTVRLWERNATAAARSFRAASAISSAQLSADGKAVAVSDANARVDVVDLDTGRVVRELDGPAGSSRFVLVDVNQRRLMTGGADGTVRVWNLSTGANLAQIISTLNGWAVVDGQGRFDGSQQGVVDVQWTANQSSLAIDNFSDRYFEPGLLAKHMRDQPGFVSSAPSAVADGIFLPPQVSVAPSPGPYSAGSDVELTVTAADQGGGIGAQRLYHNGKLLPPEALVNERSETRNRVATSVRVYRVRLVAGENRIDAVAANQQEIDSEPTRVNLVAAGQTTLPNLHILTVGINKYRDSRYNLDYGVPDALAVLKRLSRSTEGIFGKIIAYQLLDESATRSKIVEVFNALRRIPPEDVLVIYLASHGDMIGEEWFMLPHDVTFSRDQLAATSIGATTLRDMLSRVGAQRVMILIDSCKSGGSIDTLATSLDRKVLRSLGREAGVAILAASRKDQLAAEIPSLGHGAFTYVLLEGLGGKADTERDGRVTATKILGYSSRTLPQLTKRIADYTQIPVAYSRGQDFVLSLARR